MKKFTIICTLLLAVLLFSSSSLRAQTLVSATALDTMPVFVLNQLTGGRSLYSVVSYKITYNTTNVDGSNTVASGAVSLPYNANCDTMSLIAYCHGTVLRRADVPSRNNTESTIGKAMASVGHAVVMPDYLGLGDNAGLHPYIHAESEATATLDAVRAAREFIQNQNPIAGLRLNSELFVTGYSQGGHAAMATANYIQDNNLFATFNLIGTAPASGPYDLAGSQSRVFIDDDPYSNPGYVVYLLMAYERVYGNIYNNISDILKSPYDTLIPPFFNGNFDMDTVNKLLPMRISGFLEDTVLQNFRQDSIGQNHPIWQALNANTNYNWSPQREMRMYYCTNDEQVNFENALKAKQYMQAQGSPVKAIRIGPFDHGGCVVPAVTESLSFVDSLSTGCGRNFQAVGRAEEAFAAFSFFPNPARETLHIQARDYQEAYQLAVFRSDGAKIFQSRGRGDQTISLANWPAGIYIIQLHSEHAFRQERLVVQY